MQSFSAFTSEILLDELGEFAVEEQVEKLKQRVCNASDKKKVSVKM